MNLSVPPINIHKRSVPTDGDIHQSELPKSVCQHIHWEKSRSVQLDHLPNQKTFPYLTEMDNSEQEEMRDARGRRCPSFLS